MYNNKRFTVIMSSGGGGGGILVLTQRHIFCHSGSYSYGELTLVGEKFLA